MDHHSPPSASPFTVASPAPSSVTVVGPVFSIFFFSSLITHWFSFLLLLTHYHCFLCAALTLLPCCRFSRCVCFSFHTFSLLFFRCRFTRGHGWFLTLALTVNHFLLLVCLKYFALLFPICCSAFFCRPYTGSLIRCLDDVILAWTIASGWCSRTCVIGSGQARDSWCELSVNIVGKRWL